MVRVARTIFDAARPQGARFEDVAAELMFFLARKVACAVELPVEALEASLLQASCEAIPLQRAAFRRQFRRAFDAIGDDWARAPSAVEDLGVVYEALIASTTSGKKGLASQKSARKRSGSFYTPVTLAERVVSQALAGHLVAGAPARWLDLRVVDPAAGAGVFLLQACRQLASRVAEVEHVSFHEAGRQVARRCIFGADSNPLSVAVLQVSLWLLARDREIDPSHFEGHLFCGDSLVGHDFSVGEARAQADARLRSLREQGIRVNPIDWRAACPDVAERGFDVVCGNPPWVAFAGRSAQPLEKPLREYYSLSYAAWRGFPTLHGLFVERGAGLAPGGTVALLMPSPVADLDGYRFVRRRLTQTHRVHENLLEFGQDAFETVTQPCFALVADADSHAVASEARWTLSERQRVGAAAEQVRVPDALAELRSTAPRLPAEVFGEYGFQTSRLASETLLLRAEGPDELYDCPLLEGRNVREFFVGPPRLFLRADPELLRQARCRLRSREQYRSVDFVVRQTAPVPIAALHTGLPFRNSLLGGFAGAGFSAALLVALLNSTLYRALHLATQRDARQAAFPQVKLAHLRGLPAPPPHTRKWRRLESITGEMTRGSGSPELAVELDDLTFELFSVAGRDRGEIRDFLKSRAPKYAR